jgi:hypothetical protein
LENQRKILRNNQLIKEKKFKNKNNLRIYNLKEPETEIPPSISKK